MIMSPSSPEESVFYAAIQLDPSARAAYLAKACGPDGRLRDRVDALLSAYGEGEFLEAPAAELEATRLLSPVGERPGDQVGPYKLLEQIGEGGMGLVFVAEQSQPLRRRVALKIIKPGLDTRAVIARFEAERQALALMDHTNIARVYDAGATDSGRPFFVMELVRGAPITDYCHERSTPLRQRLELLIEVCHAVQHAHQKGVIHRDLKPTNILVSQSDIAPVSKVIDFGVAKATSQPLTEHTVYTQFSQIIGTPLYMSPEQADLGNQDVDTRSDVYSLGVVLYELLTGTTPFEAERLQGVGHDEMRRIIREEEPPKPSTRATTAAAAKASTVAAPSNAQPRIGASVLKGDLDWIVMKALDKDRGRRYDTPSALAADLLRYLERQPVAARPPSYVDKIIKWSHRHRGLTRTAAAVLVIATFSLGVATLLINRSRRDALNATETARGERERAEDNLQLALEAIDSLYTQFSGDRLAREPKLSQVRQEFLQQALDFYLRFAEQNRQQPSNWPHVGRLYGRIGGIYEELGKPGPALLAFDQEIRILQEFQAQAPLSEEHALDLAEAHGHVARTAASAGLSFPATSYYTESILLLESFGEPFEAKSDSPNSRRERLLASHYSHVGRVMGRDGNVQDAAEALRRAVAIHRRLVELYANDFESLSAMAATLQDYSWIRHLQGDSVEAERLLNDALEAGRRAVAISPDEPSGQRFLRNHHLTRADINADLGQWSLAGKEYRRGCDLADVLAAEFSDVVDDQDLAIGIRFSWGCARYELGDAAGAADLFGQCRSRGGTDSMPAKDALVQRLIQNDRFRGLAEAVQAWRASDAPTRVVLQALANWGRWLALLPTAAQEAESSRLQGLALVQDLCDPDGPRFFRTAEEKQYAEALVDLILAVDQVHRSIAQGAAGEGKDQRVKATALLYQLRESKAIPGVEQKLRQFLRMIESDLNRPAEHDVRHRAD